MASSNLGQSPAVAGAIEVLKHLAKDAQEWPAAFHPVDRALEVVRAVPWKLARAIEMLEGI